MGTYDGKVVLVTGSSRGVGEILRTHFLAEGAQVIGVSTGPCIVDHTAYTHREADLSDPASIQQLFAGLRTGVGRLDVVVNNAAVLTSQYAMIMPASAAQAMVQVNLLAPFLVARESAKLMRKARTGRIINISSMASRLEPAGDSVYAACKAGLETLSGVLAKELASLNITCNTLGVTAIETNMLSQLPRDKINAVIQGLPLPRFATPQDILNVVDFFASDRSSYVTAQTIFLGGVH